MENRPEMVVLHCSATQDYPKGHAAFDLIGAADIDQWHRKRGWREIGYHFVIRRTGVIEEGSRHWTEYGAHVEGHNINSLGVCYVGTRWPTDEQVDSLLGVFGMIWTRWGIHPEKWFGHYEFNSQKTCPGISMHVIREMFELELERLLNGESRGVSVVQIERSNV